MCYRQSDDPSHVSGSGEAQHKKYRVTDTEHDVSEKELAPSASQRPTKQMRRPRVTKSGGPDTDNEKKPSPKDSQIDLARPLGADPTSEDDVQTMGDAFLDKLSLGLR